MRFHHRPGTQVKTTSRNEFDPRSTTASRCSVTVMAEREAIAGLRLDAEPRFRKGAPIAPRTVRGHDEEGE